jgi:hypothetical protein
MDAGVAKRSTVWLWPGSATDTCNGSWGLQGSDYFTMKGVLDWPFGLNSVTSFQKPVKNQVVL